MTASEYQQALTVNTKKNVLHPLIHRGYWNGVPRPNPAKKHCVTLHIFVRLVFETQLSSSKTSFTKNI